MSIGIEISICDEMTRSFYKIALFFLIKNRKKLKTLYFPEIVFFFSVKVCFKYQSRRLCIQFGLCITLFDYRLSISCDNCNNLRN